jgi:hypothetical protein
MVHTKPVVIVTNAPIGLNRLFIVLLEGQFLNDYLVFPQDKHLFNACFIRELYLKKDQTAVHKNRLLL